MITDEKVFSLANHAEAIEMFDRAAEQVFKNILDPNSAKDVVREVKLVMRFKPDPDTGMISTDVSAGKKLAAQKSYREKIVVGFENGKYIARRIKQQQVQLPLGQVAYMGAKPQGEGDPE